MYSRLSSYAPEIIPSEKALLQLFATLALTTALGAPAHGQVLKLNDGNDDRTQVQTMKIGDRPFEILDDMLFVQNKLNPLSTGEGIELWPEGKLIYEFGANVNDPQRIAFLEACDAWASVAAISCVERNGQTSFVSVISDSSSYATIGKLLFEGRIGIFSWDHGTILHELGHAFGLVHEHVRSDRHNFITVEEANIVEYGKRNYRPFPTFNLSMYDYGSIMHYGPFDFSKNGMPTITPSNIPEMGQRDGLSFYDGLDMKFMYGEDDDDKSIIVSSFIGRDFQVHDQYSPNGYLSIGRLGYDLQVVKGPKVPFWEHATNCEKFYHVPVIATQSPRSGTVVGFGSLVELTTTTRRKLYDFPPPDGEQCY